MAVYTHTHTYTRRATNIANYNYIVDENGRPVGIVKDPGTKYERRWLVGDNVKIEPDCKGFICAGITKPGLGRIVEIREDPTDHWFCVQMYGTNETGFCKEIRFVNR